MIGWLKRLFSRPAPSKLTPDEYEEWEYLVESEFWRPLLPTERDNLAYLQAKKDAP